MLETLFIRLGCQAHDAIQWLIWSEQQQDVIASGDLKQASELSHLSEKAAQRNVVGFVHSNSVVLKQLKVPGKSLRAITAAAPYMLEDELAQDVESLFFAYANLPKDQHDNNCFVAAVEREQLLRWLSWLNEANIPCKTLIPDVLALPLTRHQWSAISLNNQILLRQGVWQGMVVEENLWALISEQWRDISKKDVSATHDTALPTQELESLAESMESESSDSNKANASQANTRELSQIGINAYSSLPNTSTIHIEPMPEELPLALMAKHVNPSFFNLLQGEFKVKNKRSANAGHWMWVAGIAGVALLMSVAYKSAQLIKLNSQLSNVEAQIIEIYKAAFPKTKRVRIATIKSLLNRKLSEIGSASSDVNFLTMLNRVQPAFKEVTTVKPDSMRFDAKRNELRISATSNNYQSFEQFKNALENQSLTVSQGAQNNAGDQVTGSFTISSKGPR